MAEADGWNPTWAVSPGEILVEALEERGMSQADLGRRMARPTNAISEIAAGTAAITPETAIQLERALGISAALWLGLESRYREALARA
jgi:addiction module HigA family antidote